MWRHVSILCLVVCFSTPIFVTAQSLPTASGSSIVVPNSPQPFATSTVQLQLGYQVAQGLSIQWYIDGIHASAFDNARFIRVRARGLGTPTNITATVVSELGTETLSEQLVPRSLSIILESNASVPPWYKGRALPADGSTIQASAVFFSEKDPVNYTYTWRIGEDTPVILDGEHVSFPAPDFPEVIFLTVTNETGSVVAETATDYTPATPELYLYAVGLYDFTRLGDTYTPRTNTLTVYPGAFYLSGSPSVHYTVNGTAVSATQRGALVLDKVQGKTIELAASVSYGAFGGSVVSANTTIQP